MSDHIVTAYGLFWERAEVEWKPGQGGKRQILGRLGAKRPKLKFCDFRLSAGFYILWNDYGPVYVGMARGNEGLFQRLSDHHDNKAEWTRFSWFAVDSLVLADHDGWLVTEARTALADLSDDKLVRELEAMMILALGTHSLGGQRRMAFQNADQWIQVTGADHAPGGLCRRPGIALELFDQRRLGDWASA